jgi:hypothetical protein
MVGIVAWNWFINKPPYNRKDAMDCPTCQTPLRFARWSNRRPARSEALAICSNGCGKFAVRYWRGQPTSEPYRFHKDYPPELLKKVRTVRLSDVDMAAIEAGRLRLVIVNKRITLAVNT